VSTFAGDLVAQGIAALRSGAREQAQVLLARATALEPQHEQAWLWLSGAVTTPAERQQCLERVLSINPASQAAQRGLTLLGAAPREPVGQPEPSGAGAAMPAAAAAPALLTTPAPQPAVAVAPAPQTDPVPVFMLPSLFSDAALPAAASQPALGFGGGSGAYAGSDHSFNLPSIFSPAPAEQPAAASQEGASGMAPDAATSEADENAVPPLDAALLAFIVKRLGQSSARDDAVRAVIGHLGCSWPVAEQLVREVMVKHRGQVVKSRRPRTILIGSLTLLGGIGLVVFGGIVLASMLDGEHTVRARAMPRAIGMVAVGLVMILGSLVGMWQELRA
jgi:hypothetical protein